MKKVLLIGDSIRLSYIEKVKELLKDTCEVTGPEDNCRFSAYTLFNLVNWAPDDDYDVIQWNNGQWDTSRMLDGVIHTSLESYLANEERIANILKKKTKRLIFATTTPVWPEKDTSEKNQRNSEVICKYNEAAVKLLEPMGIEINDLYTPISTDVKKYICDDMVHLTEEGVAVAAQQVADFISKDF